MIKLEIEVGDEVECLSNTEWTGEGYFRNEKESQAGSRGVVSDVCKVRDTRWPLATINGLGFFWPTCSLKIIKKSDKNKVSVEKKK